MEGFTAASYGDAIADVYDEWYARTDAGVGDPETIADALAHLVTKVGGPVLELGIGTGRLALPLSARGVDVTGIDASAAMVARLRAKPGGDRIPVVVGDMATDLPPGPFGLVFCATNTWFALRDAAAQERCLAAVAPRLRPGGLFVVEAVVPDVPDTVVSGVDVRAIELDHVILTVSRTDPTQRRTWGQHIQLSEQGVRLRPFSLHWVTPAELDEAAARAGLELVSRAAGWRGEPFEETSAQHVSVYRRADATDVTA